VVVAGVAGCGTMRARTCTAKAVGCIAIEKVDGRLRMVPPVRWDETVLPSLARKAPSLGERSALVCLTCCKARLPVGHASLGQGR
jgi:hypothetical protein